MVDAGLCVRRRLVIAVVVVMVIGLAARTWVLLSPLGAMNGDEAYTGLQAVEATRGRFAVVIQGATYTAVLESYLFAPFVWLFGNHVVALKMIGIVGWVAASVAIGFAARRLVPGRAWVLAPVLLWLAPGAMTIVSTRAYVGYGLGLTSVICALWACARVLDMSPPTWRWSALAGGLCGLAVYAHPMFLAVVGPLVLVPCVVHIRRVTAWWIPAISAAIAVNLPFLAWNAANGWPSLDQPVEATDTGADRLERFFTGLMPRALGLRNEAGEWIHARPVGLAIYAVLALATGYGVIRLVWRSGRLSPKGLLVALPLVACWPIMAALPNLAFVLDSRYAVIPLPFVVIALAAAVEGIVSAVRSPAQRWGLYVVATGCWLGLLSVPLLHDQLGTDLGDPNTQVAHVIDVLDERGIRRVAGTYWVVLPIEYQSDNRIRAAVAGNPYVVRFPTSQRIVESADPAGVAFAFYPEYEDPAKLRMPAESYERTMVDGIVLYLPLAAPAI